MKYEIHSDNSRGINSIHDTSDHKSDPRWKVVFESGNSAMINAKATLILAERVEALVEVGMHIVDELALIRGRL